MDAASRLVHVKGFRGTSVDDVLRECGIGKGNFYYYFKSKEELGYAILDRAVQGFFERTLGPAVGDPSLAPLDRVRIFLDRVLATQRQRSCVGGCPIGNLAAELSDVHEGFRHRLSEVFGRWRRELAGTLREAQAEGSLAGQCDAAQMASFVVSALEGAILMTKVMRKVSALETCVHELKAHLSLYATGRRA